MDKSQTFNNFLVNQSAEIDFLQFYGQLCICHRALLPISFYLCQIWEFSFQSQIVFKKFNIHHHDHDAGYFDS